MGPHSLQIQSVIYNLDPQRIFRAVHFLANAVTRARRDGLLGEAALRYGDCSPEPALSESALLELRDKYADTMRIDYQFFGENLGSAEGNNRLLTQAKGDFVTIMNPDVLVFPNAFSEMIPVASDESVGLVEAKQLPIEHPKYYDRITGETSWASTALALGRHAVFAEAQGFDSKNFFLYCDDVDLSWRIRLAGLKVIYLSTAAVIHDKRLNQQGNWIVGRAEEYYSAEAAMLLTYKYSRQDLTKKYLTDFEASPNELYKKAAAAIRQRMADGQMPKQIDSEHEVGEFIDYAYAKHRFVPK